MRLLVINANTDAGVTARIAAVAREAASPGTEIEAVTAPFGSTLILSRAESAIAGHAVVTALARHVGGCDAAVIAVGNDAGLAAARELSPVPVVGITEASLLTAAMLGGRFGVVVFGRRVLPAFEELVAGYGLAGRLAGTAAIEMAPADFAAPDRVAAAVGAAVRRLALERGAESVVVTGAVTTGLSRRLEGDLPVPLLDGVTCGVLQAELLVRLGAPKPRAGSYAAPPLGPLTGVDPALAGPIPRLG